MAGTDPLGPMLANWSGTISAPQEERQLDGRLLEDVAAVSGVSATAPIERPYVCTAFDGTSLAAASSLLLLWARGYAPAPLDMRLGKADLAQRLAIVRPSVVFTTPQHRALVGEAIAAANLSGVAIVSLGEDPGVWRELPAFRVAGGDDPGLVVFTSGTTGTPKGVLLSRANLAACASAVAQAQRLSAADRVLNALSLAHVNAPVVALLATILSRGSVVLLRRFEPAQFWRLVWLYGVTWANLVPPLIATLARYPRAIEGDSPAGLRFVRSASAPLPVQVLNAFERQFGVAVVESYGISEAASQVTINDPPPGRRIPGAVGTPRGVQLRLVDEQGLDVAPGEPGEVLVQGPSVMRGYLDNPAATAVALRDGWLYTGDLGVLDTEGVLRIVGRRTEIINRGGEKIAPRLVEEAVLEHADVTDVAVVGVPDPIYGEEIKAFVVVREGSSLRERDLRAVVSARLPLHARPRAWEIVASIPRNAAGKILRRELVGSAPAPREVP